MNRTITAAAATMVVITAGSLGIGLIAGRQLHLWEMLAISLPGGIIIGTIANRLGHRIATKPNGPMQPPEDIQLHKATGETIPLDAVYLGHHDGAHTWQAIMRGHQIEPGDHVTVAVLPAHTTIRFEDTYGDDIQLPPPTTNH